MYREESGREEFHRGARCSRCSLVGPALIVLVMLSCSVTCVGSLKAKITHLEMPNAHLRAGDRVTARITVKNTGTETAAFYVGVSFLERNGSGRCWDAPYGRTSRLSQGMRETVSLTWVVPAGASSGSYKAALAVWRGESDGRLVGPALDRRWRGNAVSVDNRCALRIEVWNRDDDSVLFGIWIDGKRRSLSGSKTWTVAPGQTYSLDSLLVSPGEHRIRLKWKDPDRSKVFSHIYTIRAAGRSSSARLSIVRFERKSLQISLRNESSTSQVARIYVNGKKLGSWRVDAGSTRSVRTLSVSPGELKISAVWRNVGIYTTYRADWWCGNGGTCSWAGESITRRLTRSVPQLQARSSCCDVRCWRLAMSRDQEAVQGGLGIQFVFGAGENSRSCPAHCKRDC